MCKRGHQERRDHVLSGSIEGGLENLPEWYKVSKKAGLEALEICDEVELLDVDLAHYDDGEPDDLSELQDGSPGLELDHTEICDGVGSDEDDIAEDGSGS